MSRTDKDVPYRVAVEREGIERHDHRFGECDFAPEMSVNERLPVRGYRYRWTCGLEIDGRYSYTLTFLPRTRRVRVYRDEDLGSIRGAERRGCREAVKAYRAGDLDAVNSVEYGDGRTRHAALWNAW